MIQAWTISDAKARFSELVSLVSRGEPQRVTRNGQPVCLMVSPLTYSVPDCPTPPELLRERPKGLTLSDGEIDALFLGALAPAPDPLGLAAPEAGPNTSAAPGDDALDGRDVEGVAT